MDKLIYYPGFEVQDEKWLKFALLYIDELNPIIPPSGQLHLSDNFRMLQNETDLIHIHRPSPEEGTNATLDATRVLEDVIRYPDSFKGISIHPNAWRHSKRQTFTIFSEKYIDIWEDFCLQYKLGQKHYVGLQVHPELGQIYMSLLAQVISEKRGIASITDNKEMDKFGIFCRRPTNETEKRLDIARGIIELKLPGNLPEISLRRIVEHRNQSGFKDHLRAFHAELNNFLSAAEVGKPEMFEDSLKKVWKSVSYEIMKIGIGVMVIYLGISSAINVPNIEVKTLLEEIGGSLLTIDSFGGLKKEWIQTKDTRFTRKYLNNLKRLTPDNYMRF